MVFNSLWCSIKMFHICVWMQISVGYLAYFIIGLLDSRSRALLGEETSLTWAFCVIWVQAGNSRKEQVSERLLPSLLGRQGFSEATESRWELEEGDKLHVPQACGESYELPELPRRHGPQAPILIAETVCCDCQRSTTQEVSTAYTCVVLLWQTQFPLESRA